VTAVVLLAALAVAGLTPLTGLIGRPAPATAPQQRPAALVITRWVRDSGVVNGPWPGYRPQIAYRGTLTSVKAVMDPSGGGDWVLEFAFDSAGADVFAALTTDAFGACPDVCPERHVTSWLGLTQDDVDHWNDRANAEYRPVSQGGKLLTDPVVVTPITGGQGFIRGNFTHEEAVDLARRLGGQ
jgi:preprotein translocase subunit SecD